jgi:hypothetical protein
LTECGRPVDELREVVSRQAFLRLSQQWGQVRTALLVCMACFETARRWKSWDEDPIDGLKRVIYSESSAAALLRCELRALAMLAEKYRQEFDKLVAGVGKVVQLSDRRSGQ